MTSIIGSHLPMIVGLSVGALGFLSLLMVGHNAPAYGWLVLPLTAIGLGASFTMPAATIAIIHSLPSDRAGIASGLFNTSRQLGSLIGVAIFGTIISTSSSFMSGMHTSLVMAGCIYLVGAILIFCVKQSLKT